METVSPWPDYAATKAKLLGGLSGTVLELGAGRGANFGLLPPTIDWIGLEPHAKSRTVLFHNAAAQSLNSWRVLPASAEQIPLPEASVDAVLSTVVLCSVADLETALSEVRRVLRPAGQFIFFEHVAAPRGTWTRALQRLATPITRTFDRGCNPSRDIAGAINAAGFAHVDLQYYERPGLLHIPFIAGTAHK